MTSKEQLFAEYLGDIDTEALLQNLKNTNEYFNSIDVVRQQCPKGFTVLANFTKDKLFAGLELVIDE